MVVAFVCVWVFFCVAGWRQDFDIASWGWNWLEFTDASVGLPSQQPRGGSRPSLHPPFGPSGGVRTDIIQLRKQNTNRCIYFIWNIIWLWDNTAKRNIKRHRAHWAVLALGCIRLFVLHTTKFYRAFRSVFRFVSDDISDIFCSFCTQTAFFYRKAEGSWWFSDNFSDNLRVVCTGTNNAKKIWVLSQTKNEQQN